jgi:hypothetical protein
VQALPGRHQLKRLAEHVALHALVGQGRRVDVGAQLRQCFAHGGMQAGSYEPIRELDGPAL